MVEGDNSELPQNIQLKMSISTIQGMVRKRWQPLGVDGQRSLGF